MKVRIDLNDEALELAAKELGTATTEDTVNAALEFVASRRRRVEELLDDPRALGLGRTSRTRRSCDRLGDDGRSWFAVYRAFTQVGKMPRGGHEVAVVVQYDEVMVCRGGAYQQIHGRQRTVSAMA